MPWSPGCGAVDLGSCSLGWLARANPCRRLAYTWHITQGWPLLMSSLKNLLETGDVLPTG